MTHQDQREVRRQMKEKVKRVGEMPKARDRFGITLVANALMSKFDKFMAMGCVELLLS